MIGFLWRRVLETNKRCRQLEDDNLSLTLLLRQANDANDELRERVTYMASVIQQRDRDADLLALCAKDRRAAVEIIRTAHEIDRQAEVSHG